MQELISKNYQINDGIIEYYGGMGNEITSFARSSVNTGDAWSTAGTQGLAITNTATFNNRFFVGNVAKGSDATWSIDPTKIYRVKYIVSGTQLTSYINATNGAQLSTNSYNDAGGRTSGYVGLFENSGRGEWVDWYLTRRHITPEPQWATWTYTTMNITDWSNNKTNNQSLVFDSLTNSPILFNITTNRVSDITQWYVNGSLQAASGDNFSYSFPTAGTVNITVNVNNTTAMSTDFKIWNVTAYNYTLQLLSPGNGSTGVAMPVTLMWREWPQNTPHTYQVATDYQFINIVVSGVGTTHGNETVTALVSGLSPSTTYYWRVKNATFPYTDWFNFTTSAPATVPGRLNISVFDEQNPTSPIMTYTANIYGADGDYATKTTTNGWVNFSSAEVTSQEYLIIVVPNLTYSQRMILVNSPGNATLYVPSTVSNTVYLVSFSLLDVTGLFPYKTSTITVIRGGLIMDKSYFSADGTHPVYLINGSNYQIQIQNANNIFHYGTYIPVSSGTSSITINNFGVNESQLNPFVYNITYNINQINLNWNDANAKLSNLNFTVYKGFPFVEQCQLTTSVSHGQSVCSIDNTTKYSVIFSASLTDGTYKNVSFIVDYSQFVGARTSSISTSSIDGSPIGIGYLWNYGTFTMPSWVYNWVSLILIIILFGSFGGYHSGLGGIITLIFALLLEVFKFFRPLGESNTGVLVTMGITGALLFLNILYYLQHKDRGG